MENVRAWKIQSVAPSHGTYGRNGKALMTAYQSNNVPEIL